MHNYRSNQSAFMTRFGPDLRHQYGIFGGKSQTSFSRNATRAGSEEGQLFSQATIEWTPSSPGLLERHRCHQEAEAAKVPEETAYQTSYLADLPPRSAICSSPKSRRIIT